MKIYPFPQPAQVDPSPTATARAEAMAAVMAAPDHVVSEVLTAVRQVIAEAAPPQRLRAPLP